MNRIISSWNRFFFAPTRTSSLELFRMAWGTLVLLTLALRMANRDDWFGVNPIVNPESVAQMMPAPNIDLLLALPSHDPWLAGFLGLGMLAAACVVLGLFTRLSTFVVLIVFASVCNRAPVILTNGDSLLRALGFFLLFSAAGATWSVDAVIRKPSQPFRAPWAQRLMQIQASVFYLGSVLWKVHGRPWIDGSAVYTVLHLESFRHFPVGWIAEQVPLLRLMTWATLVIEFALATLIWIRPLRKYVICAGICLHLGIDYALNLPLFQWSAMATYLLFVDPDASERFLDRVSRGIVRRRPAVVEAR
jgi:hypothetical protein